MRFECHFIQDWVYTKRLYSFTRKQDRRLAVIWGVLCAVLLIMAFSGIGFRALYLFLAAFAAFRGFFLGWIRLRRIWKRTCAQRKTDRIDTTIVFAEDGIQISETNGLSLDIPWSMVACVRDLGAYIKIEANGNDRGGTYAPKSGFENCNTTPLYTWLRNAHPELVQ